MTYCIAIVGRANVGKSSLFNAIYGHRVAIVDPAPGITRDRIAREIPVTGGRRLQLVDTGGVGMETAEELAEDVDIQINLAISRADLILFVVDAGAGLHPRDGAIAARLRASGKDVMVIANKAENDKSTQNTLEFFELGLGKPLAVSARHKNGLKELKKQIMHRLESHPSKTHERNSMQVKIAIVGQRNAGKSTLINQLAQEERVLVSELPGTTRDSVDVAFSFRDGDSIKKFMAIDTAGVRRKKQLKKSVDYYSQVRTHQSVQRADVVVHMIDAHRLITKVDKQWEKIMLENYKPTIIALNKMDLITEDIEKKFVDYVWTQLPAMRFAPVIFISAKTGENVIALLEVAESLYQQSITRVKTSELNQVIKTITARRPPPSGSGSRGKILFATQVGTKPPSIALFVNDSADITDSYQRFLASEMRDMLPYPDVPIRLMTRRRKSGEKSGSDRRQ